MRGDILAAVAVLVSAFGASIAYGHPGGLDGSGCHHDRKNGGYHCHRPQASQSAPRRQMLLSGSDVYYPNCTAARAAGVTPVRYGQPGYGKHLDRDGDGVACE